MERKEQQRSNEILAVPQRGIRTPTAEENRSEAPAAGEAPEPRADTGTRSPRDPPGAAEAASPPPGPARSSLGGTRRDPGPRRAERCALHQSRAAPEKPARGRRGQAGGMAHPRPVFGDREEAAVEAVGDQHGLQRRRRLLLRARAPGRPRARRPPRRAPRRHLLTLPPLPPSASGSAPEAATAARRGQNSTGRRVRGLGAVSGLGGSGPEEAGGASGVPRVSQPRGTQGGRERTGRRSGAPGGLPSALPSPSAPARRAPAFARWEPLARVPPGFGGVCSSTPRAGRGAELLRAPPGPPRSGNSLNVPTVLPSRPRAV